MTPDGSQLCIASPASGTGTVIDRATSAVRTTLMTGSTPRRIAFTLLGNVALLANEVGWVDLMR
jgi:YVTN family beta-propeller protein